jgi:hypothetical protein
MPPKHPLNEGEETPSEEMAQKRMRQDTPAVLLVDDMEKRMKDVNERLPPEYDIASAIFEIPRNLLQPGTSAETVPAELERFKDFCQSRLDALTIKLEETQAKSLDDGRLIFPFVASILF